MCSILIVEDEKIVADGVHKTLHDAGYLNVTICYNGIEAIDYISSNPVDIVIADIKMPLMDGLSLIKQVSENFPDIQVIILSGYGEFNYAREAMKYNVNHYLLKPYDRKELISIIDNMKTKIVAKKQQDQDADETNRSIESNNRWIIEMVRYVQENISNSELSLKKLAREVLFVNEGYLSRLFNREMGVSFPKYVTRIRIERAKQLLEQNADIKIYELSQQTGFGSNARYFSQVFKYYTGINPTEYKAKS